MLDDARMPSLRDKLRNQAEEKELVPVKKTAKKTIKVGGQKTKKRK